MKFLFLKNHPGGQKDGYSEVRRSNEEPVTAID